MSQDKNWEDRFKEWRKQEGLKDDASALEVFRSLMEARDRDNRTLVTNLNERFNSIDVILQETHSERKNQ